MIRPIRIYGDQVLHQRAQPVTAFDQELSDLVRDMFEIMKSAPGVGLAAPQVGVALQVFVYDYPDDDDNPRRGVVINPTITIGPVSEEEPDEEEIKPKVPPPKKPPTPPKQFKRPSRIPPPRREPTDEQLYDNANIEILRQRLYQQTRQRLQNDLFSY